MEKKKERGLLPPSRSRTGGQVGPLATRGRRRRAGGAQDWGGAGHPKEEGKKEGDFGLVVEEVCGGGDGDFEW